MLAVFCINTLFGDSVRERNILVLKKLIYLTLEKMGIITDHDESNIISISIKELSEEERQDYLVAREHFKAQLLKGFKKDQQGQVVRV